MLVGKGIALFEGYCARKNTGNTTSWLGRPFLPVQQIFPHWHTARVMLEDFCQKTEGWIVSPSVNTQIGLAFPIAKNVKFVDGLDVPMVETFPPEERGLVKYICNMLMLDYVPDFRHLVNMKVTPETSVIILAELRRHECGPR